MQTPRDIVCLTVQTLATETAPLGNAALGAVLGSPTVCAGFRALDKAAVAGDLDATKHAGRQLIYAVRALVTERA